MVVAAKRFMPGSFRRAVWEVEDAPTGRFVALVLSVLADKAGFVEQPVFRVAEITGYNVRTVQRVLSRLVGAGVVQQFGMRFGAVRLIDGLGERGGVNVCAGSKLG